MMTLKVKAVEDWISEAALHSGVNQGVTEAFSNKNT
jgi:hypothetical protein